MEIEIKSKKNNPLLNRTEVYFTVKHNGEKTPGRDIIRNDLAEKLNSKKENVLIHSIKTGFGSAETKGYAKVYSSLDKTKDLERKYVIKRNKISGGKETKNKTEEKKKETDEKPEEKATEEPKEEKPEKAGETKKESEKKEQDAEEKPEKAEDKKDSSENSEEKNDDEK